MHSIKLLTDENIGFRVIYPLRELGLDIKSILEDERGAQDSKVLSIANKEKRILITTDKDFGELVNAKQLAHAGILLLRLTDDSSKNKVKILQYVLTTYGEELSDTFTVIKDNLIRIGEKRIKLTYE